MIINIQIRDFALVDHLEIDFSSGFSVFTGETGAGKSILLKALGLLLGDRADRDLVRTGAAQARVEGTFRLSGPSLEASKEILEEAGVPWEEELLIARNVSAEGGSRAFINGCGVGVAVLAKLGTHLVEVSSQHQHQGLLEEENHLGLLDRAMDEAGKKALNDYREAYGKWDNAKGALSKLQKLDADSAKHRDFLEFQVSEIRAADLRPGEEEELTAERSVLLNSEKIAQAYSGAYGDVFADDDAALTRVGRALKAVMRAAEFDPRAERAVELITEAELSLKEAVSILRDGAEGVTADPARLDLVEGRLEGMDRLKRKHGPTVEAVLKKLQDMEEELFSIDNRESALKEAKLLEESAKKDLLAAGAILSKERRRAGKVLVKAVGAELSQLGFGENCFSVFQAEADPSALGADTVRFMFAPNAGEDPKPLAAIASGGELSRVLLGVKNALRDQSVETLVFDEVDAGIGGRTADRVGERLWALAGNSQVICVTHLAQIASRASSHQRVEKALTGGRTVTRVVPLSGEERIGEIARMLGGGEIPDAAWDHARQMAARGGE